MKQYISVRAVIKQKGKTLLVRRAAGRQSIIGSYELPGGEILLGEQPEDALRRVINTDLGVHVHAAQLFDAITYTDPDEPSTQYVFILYLVSLEAEVLTLSAKYDKYTWKRRSDSQQISLTDSTLLILGVYPDKGPNIERKDTYDVDDTTKIIVYSDGGSRGNPGPSAAAYVVFSTAEEVVDQGSVYLGLTTNNQAEYHGVRLGLERALALGARTVDFRSDSMLVVNQMNGIYAIKNRELWPINERIRELITHFDRVTFTHVRREFNGLADGLVNKTLNMHAHDEV